MQRFQDLLRSVLCLQVLDPSIRREPPGNPAKHRAPEGRSVFSAPKPANELPKRNASAGLPKNPRRKNSTRFAAALIRNISVAVTRFQPREYSAARSVLRLPVFRSLLPCSSSPSWRVPWRAVNLDKAGCKGSLRPPRCLPRRFLPR